MNENPNPMLIRYSEHPAFRFSGGAEERFEGLDAFRGIDEALAGIFSGTTPISIDQVGHYFSRHVEPRAKALENVIDSNMREGDLFRELARGAIRDLVSALEDEATYRARGGRSMAQPGASAEIRQNAKDLHERGFFTTRLSEDLLAEFWREIAPWREQLEARRKSAPTNMGSCVVPLPQEGTAWRTFAKALKQGQIQESINAYSRYPLDLDYCALQLSHPHECWWKNCYEDVGLPTSDTSYLHFDQDYALIKAIVYLQPVTKANSPFTLIPGSSRLPISYAREAFFKRLDGRMYEFYKDRPAATPYYRKQFQDEVFRREFLKIPSALRGTSHFGDDILNGTDQSAWVLRSEFAVTSDVGNCTVFTGGRTLHRGGMVEQGERWVLQLGFRERDSSWRGLSHRWKKRMKAVAPKSLLGLARALKKN